MRSKTTRAFRERLAALPTEVQQLAREQYRLFRQDEHHPSLHFKMIRRRGTTLYSARIGLQYRALAYAEKSTLYWFWIGPHAEYDALLQRI